MLVGLARFDLWNIAAAVAAAGACRAPTCLHSSVCEATRNCHVHSMRVLTFHTGQRPHTRADGHTADDLATEREIEEADGVVQKE